MPVFSEHALVSCSTSFLPSVARLESEMPHFAVGSYSNLHRAVNNRAAIVKVIRSVPQTGHNTDIIAGLINIASSTVKLNHENIAPVWSINVWRTNCSTDGIPAIIMPFFKNGNIRDYTSLNRSVDKLSLLRQGATGLAYAHTFDIIHGNITPENLLVNELSTVCVSDFCLNICLRQVEGDRSGYVGIPKSWVYKPREELHYDDEADLPCSKAGDVFAMACMIYEILSGHPPFNPGLHGYIKRITSEQSDAEIIERASAVPLQLWNLLQRCWALRPADRPSMETVASEIRRLSG